MSDGKEEKIPEYTFADFLLKVAPNEAVRVSDLWRSGDTSSGARRDKVEFPALLPLYCGNCNGERFFAPTEDTWFFKSALFNFARFRCKNCDRSLKTFALKLTRDNDPTGGVAMKYGESPPFGPMVPPNVASLLGDNIDLFRKGLEAEAKGLGIGAFAYYRRVIENQKDRIFDAVIKVAERLGAGEDAIARLRAAKADRQLTKAIEAIKPGPLQALYIDGHNPLMLLYDAVSDGLHGQTDAENLVTAQTIRLLLAELAKRIEQVLADHAEVTGAVTKLLQAKAARQDGKAQAGGAPSAGKVE